MWAVDRGVGRLDPCSTWTLDRLVGQLSDEVRPPVGLDAGRKQRVEHALEGRERDGPDEVDDRPADRRADGREARLGVLERTRVAPHDRGDGRPPQRLGERRPGRHADEGEPAAQVLGRREDEVAIPAQHLARPLDRPQHRARRRPCSPGAAGTRTRSRRRSCRRRRGSPRTGPGARPRWPSRRCRRRGRARRTAGCRSSGRSARERWPMPPPRVSPPTPVVDTIPLGVASPKAWVAWSTSPQVQPPSTRTVRAAGSTWMPFIGERSMTSPSSTVPKPAALWPPLRTAIGSRVPREGDRGDDVGDVAAAGDRPRIAVDHAVVDPPRRVVVGVAGRDELPAQGRPQVARSPPRPSRPGGPCSTAISTSVRRARGSRCVGDGP